MIKTYQLNLPVSNPTNDIAENLKEANGNLSKALILASQRYQAAAMICTELALNFGERCDISMEADDHGITITGPEEILDYLVEEHVLNPACPPPREDEEEEEEEEEEDEKEFGECADCGDETPPGNLYCRNCEDNEEEEECDCGECSDEEDDYDDEGQYDDENEEDEYDD